jgi:hypothetical protein
VDGALGGISTCSNSARHPLALDLARTARATSAAFVALPVIASAAAALAWRNPRPVLAAFVVTAPTLAGVVFAVVIAVQGF